MDLYEYITDNIEKLCKKELQHQLFTYGLQISEEIKDEVNENNLTERDAHTLVENWEVEEFVTDLFSDNYFINQLFLNFKNDEVDEILNDKTLDDPFINAVVIKEIRRYLKDIKEDYINNIRWQSGGIRDQLHSFYRYGGVQYADETNKKSKETYNVKK